jgi:hypothetical protein
MKRLVLTALVLVVVYPLIADSSDSAGVKFDVEGLRSNWYVVPTGADLGFTLGSWKLVAGGGYEHLDFGRNATTGDPLTSDSNPYSWLTFPNGTLKLRHTWALDEVDLWAGAGATGYGNLGIGPPSAGEFVDLDGNTYGFFEAGATRDRRQYNAHRLESGTFVETSAQWSPAAVAARGTDYEHFSLKTSAFFPLWDWDGPAQTFSGLAAFRGDVMWTDGKAVPISLLLPTEVRGYNQIYDARLLSVLTAELRMRLPSWHGVHDMVPVGFGFLDGGQYWGYADSATANNKTGWLLGAGIGGGLEFFGLMTPTLTLGFPLTGNGGTFWWSGDFNLRF